ncbi:MAG: hypothetical protein HKN79_04600 [Flavobacteriales bacterium]|nr:hypothetical protein [Flavobacteriales bacterium]
MFRRIIIAIIALSSLISIDAPAQKKKYKAPKDPQKEALKKEEQEAKQLDKDIAKMKKEHRKLQGKKTAKRMKRNKKRSDRYGRGQKDPFLQRLFNKKKYKKVKSKDG